MLKELLFFHFQFYFKVFKLQRQQIFPSTNNTCLKRGEGFAQMHNLPILLKNKRKTNVQVFSFSSQQGIRTRPRYAYIQIHPHASDLALCAS
jgi:hypothetical protein